MKDALEYIKVNGGLDEKYVHNILGTNDLFIP